MASLEDSADIENNFIIVQLSGGQHLFAVHAFNHFSPLSLLGVMIARQLPIYEALHRELCWTRTKNSRKQFC